MSGAALPSGAGPAEVAAVGALRVAVGPPHAAPVVHLAARPEVLRARKQTFKAKTR